ncbi:MAG: tRNA (N6-isopentenyl adenosine(37)-C2)-methylthiotransferase MiaB [Candidatus Bostrichicola ureolyticus]|nr:MAG: tRNA (N6-isopentenyl adenosine(37)-C2)-methylthiotransferase MiaB [Candidatus Bostrichicola ureolyticus]
MNNYRKFYIESYGCQMNVSDSEIVTSILIKENFKITFNLEEADLIFINTCSIREKAEQTIKKRLQKFNLLKKKKPNLIIGILGCMAKRLKYKFLEEEKLVNLVIGPDSYRDIPNLISSVEDGVEDGKSAVNTILSKYETYADINPVHFENKITAFITITRGCDNMCSFCIVPFTRGRERSRDPDSIIKECQLLYNKGYKEITLLGQNVDSYIWYNGSGIKRDIYKMPNINYNNIIDFSKLLELIALSVPNMRIRFSTSNPHDMSEKVITIIKKYPNICNNIHLPVQSGSNSILKKMNRKYSREEYIYLIDKIRNIIPECSISHDIITGFCGETEQDHKDTLSLMEYVKYHYGYMFIYSVRPGTIAEKHFKDDVPMSIKKRRLKEIINLQKQHSYFRMQQYIGNIQEVLIEKESKKSKDYWSGRNSQNLTIVFPKQKNYKIGTFVNVKVNNIISSTLIGKII